MFEDPYWGDPHPGGRPPRVYWVRQKDLLNWWGPYSTAYDAELERQDLVQAHPDKAWVVTNQEGKILEPPFDPNDDTL